MTQLRLVLKSGVSMLIKTKGIILKEIASGDNDKLLCILTEDLGVIYAYAKGARRFKSRLASPTELLCYSSMVLFLNKERYSLDHADSIEQFFEIRYSVEELALASYFSEISAELGPKEGDNGLFLKLLLNSLFFLKENKMPLNLLKSLFELRALSISGFMPDLVACGGCGAFEGKAMYFFPNIGKIYCENCYKTTDGEKISLSPGALAAMRHIIYSPMEKLFSFKVGQDSVDSLATASEKFLQCQTEKSYQSLKFYHSVILSDEKQV